MTGAGIPSHARPLLAAGAALVAGLSVTACGGSSASRSARSGPTQETFAACIRAHGVPEYPDSGGVFSSGNTNAATVTVGGTAVSAALLKSAEARCTKADPYIQDSPKPSPAQLTNLTARSLKFDACIRAHGVPSYPDQKVEAGVDGHGYRYVVIGKAPKAYPRGPFNTALGVCSNLLNSTSARTTG